MGYTILLRDRRTKIVLRKGKEFLSSLFIWWEKYRWNPILAGTIESSISIIHNVTGSVGEIGTVLGPVIQWDSGTEVGDTLTASTEY